MWLFISCVAIGLLPLAAHADNSLNGGSASLAAFAEKQFGGESSLSFVPELRLAFSNDPDFIELLANAKAGQFDFGDALQDANLHVEASAGRKFGKDTSLALESSYTFDRDYDADFSPSFAGIETTHELAFNLNGKARIRKLALDFNAGATATLNNDLQRIGFASVGQHHRDHIDPEIALRTTFYPDSEVTPFLELAYVGRSYLQNADLLQRNRNYAGVELITGLTYSGQELEGDIGAIFYWRDHAQPGIADSLLASPYIDLTWRLSNVTIIQLSALADLAQDETGSPESTITYGGTLSLQQELSDRVTAKAKLEVSNEDTGTEDETFTLSPELELAYAVTSRFTLVARAGADYEIPRHGGKDLSGNFGLGFNVQY